MSLPTIRLLLEKSRAVFKSDRPLIIVHVILDITEHDPGQMLPVFERRALSVAQNYFFVRHKHKIALGQTNNATYNLKKRRGHLMRYVHRLFRLALPRLLALS